MGTRATKDTKGNREAQMGGGLDRQRIRTLVHYNRNSNHTKDTTGRKEAAREKRMFLKHKNGSTVLFSHFVLKGYLMCIRQKVLYVYT